jgi:MYXO-CTERM domain-containing protein
MKSRMMVVAAVLLVATLGGQAEASFVINVSQAGNNVVATGSGSLNLFGLLPVGPYNLEPGVIASIGTMQLGSPALATVYDGLDFSGPSSFGSGITVAASSGSGDLVGVVGKAGGVVVPSLYLSSDPLSGSATWDNTTIAGLGLTPGTYTWNWGIPGFGTDFLTLNISAVPEPSSLTMATAAAGILGLAAHRRRKARKSLPPA